MLILFRLGHPPLFIPWDDISASEGHLLFFRYVDLTFRRAPGTRLRLRKRLADKVRTEAGPQWPAWSSRV